MGTLDKVKPIFHKNEWFEGFQMKSVPEFIAPAELLTKVKYATFQSAMKVTVLIGQCFALNPVLGVCDKDTSRQRFTILSLRALYTFISIIGQSVLFGFCIAKLFRDSSTILSSSTSIMFYGSNLVTTILFLRLATQWMKLSEFITKTESIDPNTDYSLIWRCNVSCIVVLVLAVGEHCLACISGIGLALDCQPDTNLYDGYLMQSFPWIWNFIEYNRAYGIFFQFTNIQCTFNWNFADAFVINISFYLTSRLNEINKRIDAVRGKMMPSSFWRVMREDYSRVNNLVRRVDDTVSGIVFISFANNLFFICLQLLHSLEEGFQYIRFCNTTANNRLLYGYEQGIYHAYSFVFLLMRSMAVSLFVAKIHTASKEPAQMLYDVPSAGYCTEVQRFLNQVHNDTVCLSGLQFFNVKRGLVLTIAGTIVTYELVLMQFTGVTPTPTAPTATVPTIKN